MFEKMKNFINYILIGAIFTDAFCFSWSPFYSVRVYHLIFILSIFVLSVNLKKISNNSNFLIIFSLFVILSLFNIILNNSRFFYFFKQALGILVHSTVFYMLIEFNHYNIKKLFSIYLQISFIVALIGFIQALAFLFYRIFPSSYLYSRFLFDFRYFLPSWRLSFCQIGIRINSISPEPASLCFVLFPAFFVSLYSVISNDQYFLPRVKSLVVISVFVLSFSLIGFLGIVLSLWLFIYRKNLFRSSKEKLMKILLVLLFIFISFTIFSIQEVRVKFSDSKKIFSGETDWQKVNPSNYNLIRNTLVSFSVLKDNFLFGYGLGSHFISFNEHARKYQIDHPGRFNSLNPQDANSLLLRALSETGLIGFSILLIFIFNNYMPIRKHSENYFWLINNSIFILFILRLIRQGNYFSEGFFFFIWLYYFSNKLQKSAFLNKT